jgi:hypothetical protein
MYIDYQRNWLETGAKWFWKSAKPIGWDLQQQLLNIELAVEEHLPYYFDVFRYRGSHQLPFTDVELDCILSLAERTRLGSTLGRPLRSFITLREMLRGERNLGELERKELLELYLELKEYAQRSNILQEHYRFTLKEIVPKFKSMVREELKRRRSK